MPVNVGQGFLNDAEKHGLDGGRHSRHGLERKLYLDSAALAKTFHIPAKGRLKAHFIEQRRMKQVGESSRLLNTLLQSPRASATAG